jgi:glycosyltransferase involved in cell wall biosynthesis
MQPRVFLAAIGDSNDPGTWSGIPYHLLKVARAQMLIDEGLPLTVEGAGWQARRVVWNLSRVFAGDRQGGYQYSCPFLNHLWSAVLPSLKDSVVINCFQLFPPSIVEDQSIRKWFFIDQTLLQLFDHYGLRSSVGRGIAREAVEREREGYHAAEGIIAHSRWAAESVRKDYGVSASRVHVVVPGANIDSAEYERWESEEATRRKSCEGDRGGPLRLVFVGKNWQRKGLDRALGALNLARRAGSSATLAVIGCARESLPVELRHTDGVEWLGFLDKRREPARFLRTVASFDVGCLFSRAEAGGIAFREYHSLGLAVLGTDVGGSPEHLIPEASIPVSAAATNEEIATTILRLEKDKSLLTRLRESAWQLRHSVLWQDSVQQIQTFWPYSQAGLLGPASTALEVRGDQRLTA